MAKRSLNAVENRLKRRLEKKRKIAKKKADRITQRKRIETLRNQLTK